MTNNDGIVEVDYQVSDLCRAALSGNGGSLVFEILADLWNPETNPDGYVSLGLAENSLMHDKLVEYLKSNFQLTTKSLTYGEGGMGSLELRKAVAHFLNRQLKPMLPVQWEHVLITNGCSAAIEHCSYLLANPGQGILLGQPYYGTFISDIQFRPGTKVVKVRFGEIDPVGVDIIKCYEEALEQSESSGTKVKALILCNPHNPLGRCYSRQTIIALMRFCQKHQIHYISDEIYALSVFRNKVDESPAPVPFTSALSIDTKDVIAPHLVHVLWSMSKDFGANGIRLGTVVTQSNPVFMKALQMVSLYSYPSAMADNTVAKLLQDDHFTDDYIKENSEKLAQQHKTAVDFMKQHHIAYATGVNAAFFLWIDLGKAYADRHPNMPQNDHNAIISQKLLDHKVYIASGEAFGSEILGWFRIVFSQSEVVLKEGLDRILQAITD